MDVRAYLQWRIETHQAAKERARRRIEKVLYFLSLCAIAALWIAGWVY